MYEDYHRKFRVVNAESYVTNFASDRSHMMTKNGSFMMPPPNYPCISSPVSDNNLDSYISMEEESDLYGRVISVNEFRNKQFKM